MNQQEQFVGKLLKATQIGETTWTENNYPFSLSGEERITGKAYVSEIDDETLRIYPFDSKHYTDVDEYSWSPSIRLEMIDIKGQSKWEFQYSQTFTDLYRAIQFKAGNIDKFIERFLDQKKDI